MEAATSLRNITKIFIEIWLKCVAETNVFCFKTAKVGARKRRKKKCIKNLLESVVGNIYKIIRRSIDYWKKKSRVKVSTSQWELKFEESVKIDGDQKNSSTIPK